MKGKGVPEQGQMSIAGQRFPNNGGAGLALDMGPFGGQPVATLKAVKRHAVQPVPQNVGARKGDTGEAATAIAGRFGHQQRVGLARLHLVQVAAQIVAAGGVAGLVVAVGVVDVGRNGRFCQLLYEGVDGHGAWWGVVRSTIMHYALRTTI